MMKIYTRTGDTGTTGLFGGGRLLKSDLRITAIGSLDELNASLGWCRSTGLPVEADDLLGRMQHDLFALGAELASPEATAVPAGFVEAADIDRLERQIDQFESSLSALRNFVLPGGSPAGAALHLTRAVCRRAERDMVALAQTASVREVVLQYVNRAGDLLFVAARWCNAEAGVADVPWEKRG